MTQTFILGGYTKRENKGISEISFDPSTASFTQASFIAELDNPTFVATNKAQNLLFAIHKENDRGGIAGFKKEGNAWVLFDTEMGSDIPGCHLVFREATNTIYVANYHLGQIDVYLLKDNQLSHLQVVHHTGSGPHANQASSRVHFTGLNAAQSLLFTCDLGTDRVSSYSFADDGQITLVDEIKLPGGTGPRHLVLDNAEEYVYVVGELNSTTTSLKLSKDGHFTYVEHYLNIPQEAVATSNCAAIRLTKDNQYLYISSRFYNVITAYKVLNDGLLKKLQVISSHGEIPRDFIIDETDSFLLVPHQDTDNIAVFQIDKASGQLTFLNDDTTAPECVCIMPIG